MAYDERDGRRGGGPGWRGDDGFGGGWGNQVPRPHRRGDRGWRGQGDDPDDGGERYGAGGGWYGPGMAEGDYLYGDPGRHQETGEAPLRPRRHRRASAHDIGTGGTVRRLGARDYAIARHDPHYAEWRAPADGRARPRL